jgi:hypothetical protein
VHPVHGDALAGEHFHFPTEGIPTNIATTAAASVVRKTPTSTPKANAFI